MTERTVSVIVPVYKVEKYLDKCVQSILDQTFSDFELILVDDGSPDRCPQMCEDWAKRDNRIKVFHQENAGLLDAVRQGLKLGSCRYTTFVDSDDWVEPEFLQTLYDGMIEYQADVVHCNYQRVFGETVEPNCYPLRIYEEEDIRKFILPQMAKSALTLMTDSRCTKMYKTSLLKEGIRLLDTKDKVISEDSLLNFAVFGLCKRVVVLDTPPLYNYLYNDSSITGGLDLDKFLNQDTYFEILKKIAETYRCLDEDIELVKTRKYASYIYEKAISNQSKAERKREIQRIISALDRIQWRKIIRDYQNPVERVSNYLYYFGCVDLMLLLMDGAKKLRGLLGKK